MYIETGRWTDSPGTATTAAPAETTRLAWSLYLLRLLSRGWSLLLLLPVVLVGRRCGVVPGRGAAPSQAAPRPGVGLLPARRLTRVGHLQNPELPW